MSLVRCFRFQKGLQRQYKQAGIHCGFIHNIQVLGRSKSSDNTLQQWHSRYKCACLPRAQEIYYKVFYLKADVSYSDAQTSESTSGLDAKSGFIFQIDDNRLNQPIHAVILDQQSGLMCTVHTSQCHNVNTQTMWKCMDCIYMFKDMAYLSALQTIQLL